MVGRLLVGFVWLKLQLSVSRQVDFQWGSCGSIFSFLWHGWQTFSGVREAQSLVFWVKVGDFQWGSCGSIFTFLSHGWQSRLLVGSCGSIFKFLCHDWWTFSWVRVAQSFVFCVMVGRLLVGFVWLNLQFSVSWLVDFQWASCGSIFSFLCHCRQTFSGLRVAQSLVFCVIVGRFLVGFVWPNLQFSLSWLVDFQWDSCGSIFSLLCHGWQTFSGVRVAQYLVFCVMVGRLLVGFVWLKLQFSVSWQVDFQWVREAQSLVFCVKVGDLQWGSCGSIFSFLRHGRQTFSGVRVAQSLIFCVMVRRLLVGSCGSIFSFLCHVGRLLGGFVWLNLQFSVSLQVDFQWGSCGSIFSFLCHGWQTFSGVRVAQSLVFCVMVGRLLVGCVWLNIQFSVSWLVDFQWCSCGSIFSFLFHGRQTFSGVREAQSLVFCVKVGDLQQGSCGSIFSFLSHGWRLWWGSCGSIFSFLCHGWSWLNLWCHGWDFQGGSFGSNFSFLCHGRQIFSGVGVAQSLLFCLMVGRVDFQWVRVAQYLDFCVMIGGLLIGFVWLNLLFSVSWLVDFQWGSCGSIFSFLCHGWQTFRWLLVAQSLVFCVIVDRLLVGFMLLNLQFSVSLQVDFQWGSCGSIFSFLCHGWQTFSGVRVAQTLVFCFMVGRLLVGFVRLNLQFSVSRLATFSGVRVAQSLVFCLMVGRLLVGFVWLNLQFSASWLVDFQWGSCGSIFSFLRHGSHTFIGVRVSQSLVFCVVVGRFSVGFVWLNLQFSA